MKKRFTLVLFFIVKFSFSQNLVPNWSFEIFDTCPNYYNEINLSTGWSSYSQSPDYFNSCGSLMGVPMNDVGFQYAKTGNAYAGFISFGRVRNYREVVGTQLMNPLTITQKYFVSFYVARAFDSANPSANAKAANAASNKIGARFSTVQYDNSAFNTDAVPIDNRAQVFTDSVIIDTLNWVKISGSFIADSAYQYVCFGNFFTDSATTYIRLDSNATFAYYYIDDIYVSTDSLTDVKENNENVFVNIFPNPTINVLHIVINSYPSVKLAIYSALGEQIFKDYINQGETDIDISNYSKGVYFLQIEQKGGIVQKRIIRY